MTKNQKKHDIVINSVLKNGVEKLSVTPEWQASSVLDEISSAAVIAMTAAFKDGQLPSKEHIKQTFNPSDPMSDYVFDMFFRWHDFVTGSNKPVFTLTEHITAEATPEAKRCELKKSLCDIISQAKKMQRSAEEELRGMKGDEESKESKAYIKGIGVNPIMYALEVIKNNHLQPQ